MNPDALKIRELFVAAVGKVQPEGWDAFLDEACGDRTELRREVWELLQAHREAGSFLGRPVAAVGETGVFPASAGQFEGLASAATMEVPGAAIGPYILLEQIGEGGMGLVFVAEQQRPVKRRVALKLIKPGMDSRQVVARFEAERQALAMMDHPNIAKVHDGGATPEGRPYFVMELVKGRPITDYCDMHRLTTRQRLELFLDVCHAVQHAHQKGIIHRDLKPSNVLVSLQDAGPIAKVIDFGVAKATGERLTEQSIYTGFAQMIGTPLYMSPEQAGLSDQDVDTRSDVYSLGVLLYELLTGTTPFDSETLKKVGYDEMRRIIREQDPPRPSTRLSTLAAAAISTVANFRGGEPRKLSAQLRGELDWIVMRALEKDRNRRYESASAFAADVQRYLDDEPVLACPPSSAYRLHKFARRNRARLAVAASLGLALLTVAGSIGWLSRDRAIRQVEISVRVHDALDESERLYRDGKVPEALMAAGRADSLMASGLVDAELRARVHDRLMDLDTVLKLDDNFFEAFATEGYFELAGASLNDSPSRYAEFERLFALYGIDLSAQSAEEAAGLIRARLIAVDLAGALDRWARIRIPSGGKVANDSLSRKLIAVARYADPDPWRDRARQAYERGDTEALEELSRTAPVDDLPQSTLRAIGQMLFFCYPYGSPAEPVREFLRRAQRRHPEDLWLNFLLADSLYSHRPSDFDKALGFFRAVLALRPNIPWVYLRIAQTTHWNGNRSGSIPYYREALRLKPDWPLPIVQIGALLRMTGHSAESIAWSRRAIELDPQISAAHSNLGRALRDQGRLAEAIASCRKAIVLNPKDGVPHNNLGRTLKKLGRVAEAIASCRKAIELEPQTPGIHTALGDILYDTGAAAEAIAMHREAIKNNPDNYEAYFDLGHIFERQGNLDEAIACYHKALAFDPRESRFNYRLGLALKSKGRLSEAIACYRKAIETDPGIAAVHESLSQALRENGNMAEAIVSHRTAIEIDPKLATRAEAAELLKLNQARPEMPAVPQQGP